MTMGTDIHPAIEVKIEGKWHWLGKYLPKGINPRAARILPHDRNYTLFAVLAGVRNGFGFAGCYRHEPLVPISEPKGLPKDIDPALAESDVLGDHSFSYLDEDELKNYNWDQPLVSGGVISAEDYDAFILRKRKEPDNYSSGIDGPSIITLDEEEFVTRRERGLLNPDIKYYINVQWESSLKDCVGWEYYWAWINVGSYVRSWGDEGKKIEKVRVVFGFDS